MANLGVRHSSRSGSIWRQDHQTRLQKVSKPWSHVSGCVLTHNLKWVELVRNLMSHAQKPRFVFRLNGRVHLNRRGSQFSRQLAAEVCASALLMLDTPRSEVVLEYWLPTPFASFPFTSPLVRHRVPPHSERSIPPKLKSKTVPLEPRLGILLLSRSFR